MRWIDLDTDGDRFSDASASLPEQSADNNWGVITADFDNDGDPDFFVYRFGRLHGRVQDVLLLNDSDGGETGFSAFLDHGANNLAAGGHGDMGAPLDYDRDGWVDILSGSDDQGQWHLFRNVPSETETDIGNSLTIHVGYSPQGADPHGAEVYLSAASGTQFRRVGSAGTVHSQSLNNLVPFGLGGDERAESIRVRWRDGFESNAEDLASGKIHYFGSEPASD